MHRVFRVHSPLSTERHSMRQNIHFVASVLSSSFVPASLMPFRRQGEFFADYRQKHLRDCAAAQLFIVDVRHVQHTHVQNEVTSSHEWRIRK